MIATTGTVDPVDDVTTTAPSSVLIVAPTGKADAPVDLEHGQAVADLLAQVWPTGREPGYVRIVKTRRQLDNALRGMRPHVPLYLFLRSRNRCSNIGILLYALYLTYVYMSRLVLYNLNYSEYRLLLHSLQSCVAIYIYVVTDSLH